MRWLIAASLRWRVLVLAFAALLLVLGVQSARDAAYDAFPEFAPPRVEVQTEGPGLGAEEIERLVTVPLENALAGVPGITALRSKSVLGLSSVLLLFEPGADLLTARALVQERVDLAARTLPAAVLAPVILQPMSSTSRAMKVGLSSASLSQMELTDLVTWTIRPRLLAIPGVANVAVWGQRTPELQVVVDPDAVHARGLTVAAIERAARAAVALDAGGFVDTPNQRLAVHLAPVVTNAEDLGRAVVAFAGGAPVRLRDVAEIRLGHAPPIGDAVIDDHPGILLIVEKLPWGNTLEITAGVEAAFAALRPGLPAVDVDTTIFRPATFIELALHNLTHSMLVGCALVVLILLLFLFDLRTACISLCAIPLSIAAALLLLERLGSTINTMILAGLVIAIGEVVDDAIIDVENIDRRLRLERDRDRPRSPLRVVLAASLEVRSAVVFGSLVVVLMFVPIFCLDGLAGAFFRPLTLAYGAAILASLLVALTVTPALCLLLLPRRRRAPEPAPLVRWLAACYRRVLPTVLERPRAMIAVVTVALASAGFGVLQLREEFLSEFRERDFLMHFVEKPATSVAAMTRITERASRELRAIPGVRNFGSHIGRAEVADEVVGPNFTELWLSIAPDADYDATVARIHDAVQGYPGLQRDLLTYLKERVKEVLSGAGASVVLRVYGPELDALQTAATAIAEAIRDVPGVADLKIEQQAKVPQVTVHLDPEAAARRGVTAAAARATVAGMLRGVRVGEVHDGPRTRPVVLRGAEHLRGDLGALRDLEVEALDGSRVQLAAIANVLIEPTPNVIARDSASRKIDVTCNVRGSDLGAVANVIAARLAGVALPRECRVEVLGEYAARQAAQQRLLWLTGLALFGILLLLWADFRALRPSLLVFVTLPFALIGGVGGALSGGGVLTLGSLAGFVSVLGIAARNGIMLVSHYRNLVEREAMPFGRELIVRGALERLSPILMTASCAALALLPLVLGPAAPGNEIERPMAFVILGGLASSTALNLLVLPTLYLAYGRAATSTRS